MDEIIRIPGYCGNRSSHDAFWDPKLTIRTPSPRLSDCFENTLLVLVACLFLWIPAPCYIYTLYRRPRVHVKCDTSSLNLVKVMISLLIAVVGLFSLVWTSVQRSTAEPPASSEILTPFSIIISMLLIATITRLEYHTGLHTSALGFIFWGMMAFTSCCGLISEIIKMGLHEENHHFRFASMCIIPVLACVEFGLQFLPDTGARSLDTDIELAPLLSSSKDKPPSVMTLSENMGHPESRVSFISKITFFWCTSAMVKGYKTPLTFSDVPDLDMKNTSEFLQERFERIWNQELKNSGYGKRNLKQPRVPGENDEIKSPSLLLILFGQIWKLLVKSYFGLFCSHVFDFITPFLVRMLVSYVDSPDTFIWQGICIAIAFCITFNLSNVFFVYTYSHTSYQVGMKLRAITLLAIYKKALRLSINSRKQTSIGDIMNMMAVDSYKMLYSCMFSVHALWDTPIILCFAMVILYYTIGPACFAGLLFIVIFIPANTLIVGKLFTKLQGKHMVHKNARMKLLSELLCGIKILKLMAWEGAYEARVISLRNKEDRLLKIATVIFGLSTAAWFLMPYLISLVIFATYVMISPDNVLDANNTFVTLTVVNIISYPLKYFPNVLLYGVQTVVAVGRFEKFLLSEEFDPDDVGQYTAAETAVSVTYASFCWDSAGTEVLKNINLLISRGELVAVVGRVASGKSSLVASLLGEMNKLRGSVNIQGTVAFVPQQSWIQNATLRDNILFGKPFDRDVYDSVIEACCLRPDLQILPAGDLTEIGEKGLNLSGGQKQRVSLARALYQKQEVYLLDDILSAVDVHVGRHIFENVIGSKGLLARKTRLLVTHGVNFLPRVDRIILMDNGQIAETGSFEELLDHDGDFAAFVKNYLQEIDEEDETDPEVLEIIHNRLSSLSECSDTLTESDGEGFSTRYKIPKIQVTKQHRKLSTVETVDKLIVEEKTQSGNISCSVIMTFIKSGGLVLFFFVMLFCISSVISQVYTSLWLSAWSADAELNNTSRKRVSYRLDIYGLLGASQVLATFVLAALLAVACIQASTVLHQTSLNRILRAPMKFFDTTPVGRILNRLTRDVDTLDTLLPLNAFTVLFILLQLCTTYIVMAYTTPIFLLAAVPLLVTWFFLHRAAMRSVRQIKRIEAVTMSPMYSHFQETLQGVGVIKAFRKQCEFVQKCEHLLNKMSRTFYHYACISRCAYTCLNIPATGIVFISTMLCVVQKDSISGALAGLCMSLAVQALANLKQIVQSETEAEAALVSVERISEYSEIEQEASWDKGEVIPPPDWPQKGQIEFKNVSIRYRKGLDMVIRGISCHISPGEKVGVVGRTGAGKSSLTLALFRIIEAAEGKIFIDDVDICKIGLHCLRNKLTIIPQDPVLYSGTLRSNLDPLCTCSDAEIFQSLRSAHLQEFLRSFKGGLDYDVGDNGDNLSVGERQLVCLARALLRKNRILILDEATAAVDFKTDDVIQNTIRTYFQTSTVITIAHRISTITDYDRVIVLDNGIIKEFDSPSHLLNNKKSMFYGLASEAGIV